MATTETDIKKGVSILLNDYGSLTTSEVKKLLNTVLNFDEDDKEPSSTRSEPLIIQRIGNVVSHQKDPVEYYFDTYQIDKTTKPATWSLLQGLKSNGTLNKISNKSLESKQNSKSQFSPKKIDWESVNENKSILGNLGEEFVIRKETNKVLKFAPNDLDRIIHLSAEQGDGAGYDIISLEKSGDSRLIEVKTTKGGLDIPFYMSKNEREYFNINKNNSNLFLYRVYNFDKDTKQGEIKEIPAIEIINNYKFNPVSFKVTKK